MPRETPEERVRRFAATHAAQHLRTPKPRVRVCVVCGQSFLATRNDARYCSPACSMRAHRQRHRA